MKKIILIVLFFNTIISIKSQNTTFDNVSIGISYPTYGAQIKTNFPGYTGGWGRAYSLANESGSESFFTFGSTGNSINGVSTVSSNFIGKDLNNRYMTFLPNGNIGIGTSNPQTILQIGEFINNNNYKLSFPGTYNFEEIKLGQYGNGRSGLEIITHTNLYNSFGVRLFAGTDTGLNGLLFQTADATNSTESLAYSTKMAIILNGNVGIGTIAPDEKLTVKGKIHTQEVRVDMAGPLVPDYVFADDYKLKSLQEIEDYVKEHKHLPEIPSAKEIENNGLKLGEMNMALLKKMEEMTLYMIEQNKQIKNLEKKIETLTNKQ
ncbi:hypothetical protein SAMN02927916_3362 [Flavobacterium anhuiense]|uniref:Uncharacterized protein n=1 Tax=Flavobacterium anhuiense TaxID=459526 RepID=A0ABY0LY94_9FLAO|nr:tail fiber protein [Flavobacterium anhuiense]SCY78265.1 hypothetical protein SAMN02927916_3362 [Flavobacterium anhuiense]